MPLKSPVFIFLIVLLLAQVCTKTLMWAYHQANQTGLTERYCINITRPERQCHGTCYLKKQLKAVENSEKHTHQLLAEKQDLPLICQPFTPVAFGLKPGITVLHSRYLPPVSQTPVFPIFHPPA